MSFSIEITVDDLQASAMFAAVIEFMDRTERGLAAMACWHRLYGWPDMRRGRWLDDGDRES